MPEPATADPHEDRDWIIIDGRTRTMLTPREIATLWGCSVRTVYRLIRTGRLPILNLAPGVHGGGTGERYLIAYRTVRELQAARDEPMPSLE